MNERYLFRGKRVDNEEWIDGNLIQTTSSRYIHNPDSAVSVMAFHLVDPATIGQCTGLRDKKGTLIFEGDIFKARFSEDFDWIFVVRWDEKNGRFLGYSVNRKGRIMYVGREPPVEIIGNAHDNPELLEVANV